MTQLPLGTTLDGKYRLERVLGEGGFATVYEGIDVVSGVSVAINVLDPRRQATAADRARMEREAEAVGRLLTPHVVALVSTGETPSGARFLVFEHVGGRDLDEVIGQQGRLQIATAVHLLGQILRALQASHAAGVAHRDLKPANVLIHRRGDDPYAAKLLDFGLAWLVDRSDPRLTDSGQLLGTPRYMSPEQLQGLPPTPASDIFGAGVVALEMLLGHIELDGGRWADHIDRHRDELLGALGPDNAQLMGVLQRMTERDVRARFASPDAALHALVLVVSEDGVTAQDERVRALVRAVREQSRAPATQRHDAADLPPPASAISENVRFGLLVVGGCAVVVLAFATHVAVTRDEPARPHVPRVASTRDPAPAPRAPAVEPTPSRGPCFDPEPPFVGKGEISRGFSGDTQAYIPRTYRDNRPAPLLVFASDRLVAPRFRERSPGPAPLPESHDFFEMAEEHGFVIVAARAPSPTDTEFALKAIEAATESLCIDEARVYAFAVNRGVDTLMPILCNLPVRAVATASGRAAPTCQRPHLHFVETRDETLAGPDSWKCPKVGALIDEFTDRMTKLNRCGRSQKQGECEEFTCDAAFTICSVNGGRLQVPGSSYVDGYATHGYPPRARELQCFGKSSEYYPYAQMAWRFFEPHTLSPNEE